MNKPVHSFQKIAHEQANIKKKDATARALLALDEMTAKGLVINFNSLANYAHVSKAWLYRHADIREQVMAARVLVRSKRTTDPENIIKKKEAEIAELKEKVVALTQANKKLKAQLEVVYGELYQKG